MSQRRNLPNTILAFTLVELLVVIGIIAALAALLFPVFASARAQAAKATCLSNLRQTGMAIALYVQDYDGYVPYAPDTEAKAAVLAGRVVFGEPLDGVIKTLPDIKAVLLPYGAANALFRCPWDRRTLETIFPEKPTWFETTGSSYYYFDWAALRVTPLSAFGDPVETYVMGDFECFHDRPDEGFKGGFWDVLHADFHVKSLTSEQRQEALDNSELSTTED